MWFSDNIPSKLQEHPEVRQFLAVLDGLHVSKQEVISESLRVNNPVVLLNKRWLLKQLKDYGVTLPFQLPIQVMQQFLLNVDTICRLRGSKVGVELYCSVLSLGEVTVDDSNFYKPSYTLFLDSLSDGFICADNELQYRNLLSDTDDVNPFVDISIEIKSKFFNGEYPNEASVIQKFIKDTLDNQLTFSPNKRVTLKFSPTDNFVYHNLLNPYFV